jgi:hypothetical protein
MTACWCRCFGAGVLVQMYWFKRVIGRVDHCYHTWLRGADTQIQLHQKIVWFGAIDKFPAGFDSIAKQR